MSLDDHFDNPFASPLTESRSLGDHASTEAESVRRQYLSHEASCKSFGFLFLLGGVLTAIYFVVMVIVVIVSLIGPVPLGPAEVGIVFVSTLVLGAVSTALLSIGRGVRRLDSGYRVPAIVLCCLGLLGFPIGTLIHGYGLYLFVSEKGQFVFSDAYRDIRRQTPHIKYKTSIVVWIFVGLLVLVLMLAMLGLVIAMFE
jgi:hypothetical protein